MMWQTATFNPFITIHKLFIEALLRKVLSTVTVLPLPENPLSTSALPCVKKIAALTTESMVGYFVWPMMFLCVLLCKMEGCFAGTSARKYCLRLSNCSMIHDKPGPKMGHLDSTCFKNLWAGRPSFLWNSSQSSHLEVDGLNPIWKLMTSSERSSPNTWRPIWKAP